MKAFIKSLHEKAWRSVLSGWTYPTTKNANGKVILKPEALWSTEDEKLANYNSKVLHTIFSGVDADQIKLITICETPKEALDILQTTHEGTSDVKLSKLLRLITGFENLCMHEDEFLSSFYSNLCDISNKFFSLGEKIHESMLVWKIVRSLPDSFQPTVTSIEESKNLDIMKVKELMGSV